MGMGKPIAHVTDHHIEDVAAFAGRGASRVSEYAVGRDGSNALTRHKGLSVLVNRYIRPLEAVATTT